MREMFGIMAAATLLSAVPISLHFDRAHAYDGHRHGHPRHAHLHRYRYVVPAYYYRWYYGDPYLPPPLPVDALCGPGLGSLTHYETLCGPYW